MLVQVCACLCIHMALHSYGFEDSYYKIMHSKFTLVWVVNGVTDDYLVCDSHKKLDSSKRHRVGGDRIYL